LAGWAAHGSTVTLDKDFERDLEEIINSHREPLNPPAWLSAVSFEPDHQ
jgi:hypothetical protein